MQRDRKLTSIEIRPGVFRPDWSAVTTAVAQDALLARFGSRESVVDKWSVPLGEPEDCLWRCVLRFFADFGRRPICDELAKMTEWPAERVRTVLQELQERDLLGLDANASAIVYAYPFTAHSTGHSVQLGSRVLNALCAVDALGVGAMFQQDVVVMSRCRTCGADIRIATANHGRTLQSIQPANTVVWYDLSFAGCAATSCCPEIAFFCSDTHLQAWRNDAGSGTAGRRLLPTEALEVGRALFGPLLAEPASV
jgi:alkylmercury lyase